MNRKKILIIGAGLAGLATAYFLKKRRVEVCIFEKERVCGGLCRSIKKSGFTFDFSGHFLHFRNPQILFLIKDILKDNLVKHKRNAYVYSFNRYIPHPFQINFYHLPEKIARECQLGLIETHNNRERLSNNGSFLSWIYNKLGRGIAKYFMLPYNRKFWKVCLDGLTCEWTERFIVTPSIEDITGSLFGRGSNNLGYNAFFWYPHKGGIEELIKAFASNQKNIYLNGEVQEIDLNKKCIKLKNTSKERFDTLISTIPLPELGKIIKGLDKSILANFKKLRWLSIYNINFGIDNIIQRKRHWIYFPQKDISFFRVGFFHNFSPYLAPSGKGSLYVEVSYSKDRPIQRSSIVSRIKKDLKKIGIIKKESQILCENVNDIKYGYPLYDRNYKGIREKIINFLLKNNIYSCGRYGSWQYLSMEDVILEGENIANTVYNEL